MDKIQEAFFILLRAGLWNVPPQDFSDFPLTAAEWKEIYLMAKKQTVSAFVYQGVNLLPDKWMPDEGLMMQWVTLVDVIERKNKAMNHALNTLFQLFHTHQLQAVLLKGQGVAAFYTYPEGRECGDIDLYFPNEKEGLEAINIIRSSGCQVSKMPDGAWNYIWQGVMVEQHHQLVDIQRPSAKKQIKLLEGKYGFEESKVAATSILLPSPVINLLLLNTHIMKHAMGWGIGLRQICDMAMAYKALDGSYDKKELAAIYQRLGIARWTTLLHGFLVDYLHLDTRYLPPSIPAKDSRPLLQVVMTGGNFGMYQNGRTSDENILHRKWKTMCSFIKNIGFIIHYSPIEGEYMLLTLMKGQFKR